MFNWVPNTQTYTRPEQHHSRRPCALIVDQTLYIGFHAYLTNFQNSCFHYFEQVNAIWEGFQKLKKIDDLMHISNDQLGIALV